VYLAKNVAYFPFNYWLSFQRLCRLLWGYHFHFVDSTVPNFLKIGKTVAEICDFCDFQDGVRRHFGFPKVEILTDDPL